MTTKADEYRANNLLAMCALVETKIGHELSLINHRVSWLATSQTFLIIGLFTLLDGLPATPHPAIVVLLFGIPAMGLLICGQVWLAVGAAFEVLTEHLLPDRKVLVGELNRLANSKLSELGPDRYTDVKGAIPAKYIPVTFIFCWLGLLAVVYCRLYT